MKKVFIAVTFLINFVIFSQAVFSQKNVGKIARHDAKDLSYGVKVGFNSSTLIGSDGIASKMGFVLGAFAEIKLDPTLGISAEALYSQQGCAYNNVTDAYINLDYLNIPILCNYHLPFVEGLTVKAGLQPSFPLSTNVKYKSMSDEDGFSSFDLVIPVGISYELSIGVFLDARFGIGILNVFDDSGTVWTINGVDSGNNMFFQITAGYRF